MKKKNIISTGITALLIMCIVLAFSDSHQTNIRYRMWKWGWIDYLPNLSTRYMNVDPSFRDSLKGMTISEVMKWFPDLREEENPALYRDRTQPFYIDTPDFLWIGDSQWAIGFKNNRVEEFYLIKGNPKLEDRKFFQPAHGLYGENADRLGRGLCAPKVTCNVRAPRGRTYLAG